MNITEKKKLCRDLFETVWNDGKIDMLDKFLGPSIKFIDPAIPTQITTKDGLKQYIVSFRKAFPDLHFKIEDQIGEGDKVVSYLTGTATHEGEFLGIPASHIKASLPAIVIQRFENDKIVEGYSLWDAFGFIRAAGALPIHEPVFATK